VPSPAASGCTVMTAGTFLLSGRDDSVTRLARFSRRSDPGRRSACPVTTDAAGHGLG